MDYQSFQPGGQDQNQTPIASSPSDSIPHKTSTPKFIALVIFLLVLAGGAYSAIWWWGKQQVVVPSPTLDLIADWQTYTNTQYGFEFKYPMSWVVKELQASSIDYQPTNRTFIAIYTKSIPSQDFDARIDVYNDSISTVLVGNPFLEAATKIYQSDVFAYYRGKYGDTYFLATNNNITYQISGNEALILQFLSTFKFADSNQGQTVCTQDAKQCPDGSYIGRTGPNCEFVCPK